MKRALALIPLLLVLIIGAFLLWGLNSDRDPSAIPSALISEPVPEFELEPPVGITAKGLTTVDLQSRDELTAVNFFASWCVPCRAEHAVLEEIANAEGMRLVGINYRDKPEDAVKWLNELGNIYELLGADETGRVAIEWGLTGVPETFLVRDGVIVHRFAGPVVGSTARRDFIAAIAEARE